MYEAVQRKKTGQNVVNTSPPKDGYDFILSLGINELVLLDVNKNDIRKIISQSPLFLNQDGHLLLEHGYNQKNQIIELLEESFINIKPFKDFNKIDRAILAQLR